MAPVTGQELRDQIAEALTRWSLGVAGATDLSKLMPAHREAIEQNSLARADAVMAIVQARPDEQTASFDQRLAGVQDEYAKAGASWDNSRKRLDAEIAAMNAALRAAGLEYPLGAPGISDLAMQRDGQQERAEQAEVERDRLDDQLRGVRTLRLMWAKVGEHGMPDQRDIFAQCARDLGSILDKAKETP